MIGVSLAVVPVVVGILHQARADAKSTVSTPVEMIALDRETHELQRAA